jgi:hypothetical protein
VWFLLIGTHVFDIAASAFKHLLAPLETTKTSQVQQLLLCYTSGRANFTPTSISACCCVAMLVLTISKCSLSAVTAAGFLLQQVTLMKPLVSE